MVAKLGLIGGVAAAWLLTFVLMGGNVLPSLSGQHTAATGHGGAPTPAATMPPASMGPSPTSSPTGTPGDAASSPANAPGQAAAAAEQLAQTAPLAGQVLVNQPNPPKPAPPVLTFRMATFNALGSSHTHKGGHRKQKASGASRTARAGQYVMDNNIDLIGFQEMQGDQRSAFMNATGGRYALYPGDQLRSGDGENSIAYRLDTWELVKADSIPIPYFGGNPRNMPILLLRNKQTGITAYFTNFHNPADTAEFGPQGRWRAAATAKEVALFSQLKNNGYPVFVTGDMNDRGPWFCSVGPAGDLVAAAATAFGQNGCTIPGFRIDWIAGTQGVQFSNYHEDKSGLVAWMTDHPVVMTDVTIDAANFPKSVAPEAAAATTR
ncbi:MAG TPA: endonuclease/exonuclease/phosphatase family protein [Marmoricola sp.]|nr:endonuclease/exonuclease/phosphatase family protein [Marmoricola sp.]